jgi:hypothetical protein
LHVAVELAVILVVHEEDISLQKPILNQTPSIERNRLKETTKKNIKFEEDYDGLGV